MERGFERKIVNGYAFICWKPWWESGVVHGFADRSLDVVSGTWAESQARFEEAIGAKRTFLQTQKHTAVCTDLRSRNALESHFEGMSSAKVDICADAFVISPETSQSKKTVCGLVTADCIPLVVRCAGNFGLIHAGWRGLAEGIVENTLKLFDVYSHMCEVLIGPCAGPEKYEVGEEVVRALGDTVQGRKISNDKFLLDLVATARSRIKNVSSSIAVHSVGICTISDLGFNSYRRDGERAGRNLSFVVI